MNLENTNKSVKSSIMSEVTSIEADTKNLAFSLGTASDLFILLGNYLFYKKLIKCTPQHFAYARIEAESTAWDKSNVKEVNLTQIYKELAYVLHLTNEEKNIIMALESKLEWMLLKKIPDFKSINPDHLNGSDSLEFIHDNQFIEAVKKKPKKMYGYYNLCENSEKADLNNSSSFTSVFENEDTGIKNFLKKENTSEIISKDLQLLEITSSRFENILNEFKWTTGGLSAAMAGASKTERLSRKVSNLQHKVLRDLAAGLIAPTLVSYVLWLLNRANDKKIKKLFFYNFNGSLLYKIAGILKAKLQIDIDLHLLASNKNNKLLYETDTFAIVNVFDESPHLDLSHLRNNGNHPSLVFFFYSENEQQNMDINTEGYLWDASKNIGYKNLLIHIKKVIETFFLPQLEDLNEMNKIEKGDKLETPEHENHFYREGEGKLIFETVVSFTENVFLSRPFVNPFTDMRAVIASLIKAFCRNPTEIEAKVWRKLYSELNSKGKAKNIAEPYQLKDLPEIIFKGNIQKKELWKEGSLSLTPKPFDFLINISAKIGAGVNKLKKRFNFN